jgi:hypothetical protein
MNKRPSRILFSIGLLAVILLSTGCKANLITKINDNGSGVFTQEVGFSADEIATLSGLGNETDICGNAGSQMENLPTNPKMRQETRGDETWCISDVPFVSLNELATMYTGTELLVNDISITDGNIHYDITMDLTSDASQMTGPIQMKWILILPGRVSDHNADEISGSTLTWNLTPGQEINMFAEGSSKGGLSPWWIAGGIGLLCLCILVLVIIAVVVIVVLNRNKKKRSTIVEPANQL